MADNKKYYYMRLKEDFFNSPEMKAMESMRDGYKYSNILLKLYLLSLRDEGRLTFRDSIPYDVNMLAKLTGFSKNTIENALKIFQKFELIEVLDTGTIYMLDIQTYIGESTTEADRKKKYRARIESEKAGHLSRHLSDSLMDICPDKSTPEIEIEKDIELELKRERNSTPAPESSISLFGTYQNVRLSDTELQNLKLKYEDWQDKINNLSEYMKSSGKEYSSHYATICKWAEEDKYKRRKQDTSHSDNPSDEDIKFNLPNQF